MTMTNQPLGLRNSFVRLTRDKRLRLVVVGNSVTHGAPDGEKRNPSFYVALGDWFRTRFPDAAIEVIPKIIFATGSEVQIFRLDERVISEKPDLVLAEFNAANGAFGERGRFLTEPSTEGWLRRLRLLAPDADCLIQMAVFQTMIDDYRAGREPQSSLFQKAAAAHYGAVYADAAAEIGRRVVAGEEWKTYMDDGIHPSRTGYEVYSDVLIREVERQWQLFQALPETERVVRPHAVPTTTLAPDPWLYPAFIRADRANYDDSFRIESCGKVTYAVSEQPHATGWFKVAPPARIAGLLLRYPEKGGNIEVRGTDGWHRLLFSNQPKFTHGEDTANRYYRGFFGVNGLPSFLQEVEFRVSKEPEIAGHVRAEIAGFLVIERPANP